MNRKIIIPLLLVGALVIAAGVGLLTYGAVRAAQGRAALATLFEELSPARGVGAVRSPAIRENREIHFGGGITDEDLANALGITVEQLSTARQTANTAALDQAVKDGLITQAQADQLKKNGKAFPFGGRWGAWLGQNGINYEQFLADALNISVEDLQAANTKAFNARVDQAVTDGRLTQEQADLLKGQYALFNNQNFQSSMQSAFEAAVNQAVQDGVITQAQADQILNNANGLGGLRMFHGPGGFGGFEWGPGHGRGKFGPGGRFTEPGSPNTTPSTPSTPQANPSSTRL